jgi:hypothetical protein
VALLPPRLGEFDDALDVEAGVVLRVDRQTELGQPIEGARLRVDRAVAFLEELVRPRDSSRLAVTAGSFWRSEPAPEFRGFAYSGRPASSRSALIRTNSPFGMNTSPRTSAVAGLASVAGIAVIVRRFAVTSSPVVPSPRVAPWTNRPRS